ncbi:hypothetical protein F5877DRAFT_70189 [Lentinula edodes]|nr:hypothetical protein F5877DRAFT_70189 [Lentinula edodes]
MTVLLQCLFSALLLFSSLLEVMNIPVTSSNIGDQLEQLERRHPGQPSSSLTSLQTSLGLGQATNEVIRWVRNFQSATFQEAIDHQNNGITKSWDDLKTISYQIIIYYKVF